jgi:hypothetical protein
LIVGAVRRAIAGLSTFGMPGVFAADVGDEHRASQARKTTATPQRRQLRYAQLRATGTLRRQGSDAQHRNRLHNTRQTTDFERAVSGRTFWGKHLTPRAHRNKHLPARAPTNNLLRLLRVRHFPRHARSFHKYFEQSARTRKAQTRKRRRIASAPHVSQVNCRLSARRAHSALAAPSDSCCQRGRK